jgi:hypothetical protein
MNVLTFSTIGLQNPNVTTTNYTAIQHAGVVFTLINGETHVSVAQPDQKPDGFAVYGRSPEGMAEWIADFDSELHSMLFASTLSYVMGVPIEDKVFNVDAISAAIFTLNNQGQPN